MRKKSLITLSIYIPIFFICCGFLQTTSGLNQKGNKQFEEKHYESALESYRKAQIKNPDNPEVRYNLGTTLYQLDQYQEAETQLEQALTNASTKELKATAWYNFGNAQYRLGQFDKATQAYREALNLNPNDKDAKYNLELLQKKKSLFDKKQDKREQQKKENPNPSQQQKQQQQQGGGQDQKQKQQNQSQGQKNQDQGQNQQNKKQDQEQKPKPDNQEQKEEQQQPEKSNQNQEETPKEGEENKDQSNKKDQQDKQGEGQEQEKQPMSPAEPQQNQEGQKPEEGQGQQPKPLLQGQMSQENALRILNALKESEQELQVLRRPHKQTDHEPLKDW